jgi:hypothetical protein
LYLAGSVNGVLAVIYYHYARQFGRAALLVFCLTTILGVHQLRFLEFGAVKRLFGRRVFSGMIDDEVKLEQFRALLDRTTDDAEALLLIQRTCSELGFSDSSFVPLLSSKPLSLNAGSCCQLTIALDEDKCLVLLQPFRSGRPLPVEQLSDVVRCHFEQKSATPMKNTLEVVNSSAARSKTIILTSASQGL